MIKRSLDLLCNALRVLLGTLVGALIIPVIMQVLARYTGIIPVFLWTEELATFIFVWVVMVGSIIAVWDGMHFDVQVIPESSNPLILFFQKALVMVLVGAFGVMFFWYGIDYTEFGSNQNSVMMQANLAAIHVTVPIAGSLWTIFSLYRLVEAFQQYRQSKKVTV
ncbi:TRAP transporter small permease [Marinomonas sp. C2222]|uniref:TRAP transporter small permease protein n=1 Tax=Marinomonas sargassi TaxID=2984494 RepID=A0ABT2YQW7_9GAMM|nr:TRAP transporter small permease [Marinomonas sargassi]MCV2402292.1 TRAP transporter small permease [Marinomonas sargassi]